MKEIINNMANDKCVDIFYDYFKNRKDNEINNELKKLSKDELSELILENIKTENTEKALMCQIYAVGVKGVKFNNEIIELINLYLNLYPRGHNLIEVLKKLVEAYIKEYEIEKALEVCEMLKAHDYDYIHSYYSECLYKLNRLDEAVEFLEKRLEIVKKKYGQEPDEKQQKVMDSVTKKLEKYKNYTDEGHVYIPATEKGRNKLAIKIPEIIKHTVESLADTDTFVSFDLETTGFMAKWDEITEIGAVKVVNGKVVDRFSSLVKPNKKISDDIAELTGITNEMVEDAPKINSVLLDFLEFINGYDLVGHNIVAFDLKFLDRYLLGMGKSISCKVYDTFKLSKMYFAGMRCYKLTELSKAFNLEHSNAHRALSDAEVTAQLYMKCFNENR